MKGLVDGKVLLKLVDRLSVVGYDGDYELIRRTPVRDAIMGQHCKVSPAELAKEIEENERKAELWDTRGDALLKIKLRKTKELLAQAKVEPKAGEEYIRLADLDIYIQDCCEMSVEEDVPKTINLEQLENFLTKTDKYLCPGRPEPEAVRGT